MLPLLVFDYDGTIHDTMNLYARSVNAAVDWLREVHGYERSYPEIKELRAYLGMNVPEMWEVFAPFANSSVREAGGRFISDKMMEIFEVEGPRWYEGARDCLVRLKNYGFSMIVVSNTVTNQAKEHWNHFKMDKFFDGFYDSESYNYIPKGEILMSLLDDRGSNNAIMIGDRIHDKEAAGLNNIPFIGVTYGFALEGELDDAEVLVNTPSEIFDACLKLSQ